MIDDKRENVSTERKEKRFKCVCKVTLNAYDHNVK